MITGDLLYIILAFVSIYGYNGAHNLNIHHLRLYACFCTLPLVMKVIYFVILLEDLKHINVIQYPPNPIVVYSGLTFSSICIQLYLIYCIHYLSLHLSFFKERIQNYLQEM